MNFEELLNKILMIAPFLILKGLLLIFVFGYLIFALIVVRQVQLMISVLETILSPWIKILAVGHLLFAIGVFLWILFLL